MIRTSHIRVEDASARRIDCGSMRGRAYLGDQNDGVVTINNFLGPFEWVETPGMGFSSSRGAVWAFQGHCVGEHSY